MDHREKLVWGILLWFESCVKGAPSAPERPGVVEPENTNGRGATVVPVINAASVPVAKRRPADPKEKLKEEQDGIVLSPQRKSFVGGCHASFVSRNEKRDPVVGAEGWVHCFVSLFVSRVA